MLAWDLGEQSSSVGSATVQITVSATRKRDLQGHPIVVPPAVALSLLGRPLRVILENGRNDRTFLLAFCNERTRQKLEAAEDEGWLVFDNAGGIGELKVRLATAVQNLHDDSARAEALRTLYLCDSDSRDPGVHSRDATEIQLHLNKLHSVFARHLNRNGSRSSWLGRVLRKRAAENYAPPSDVLRWAAKKLGAEANAFIEAAPTAHGRKTLQNASGARGSARRDLLAAIAFKELDDETRSVLCMKQGRGGEPPRTVEAIWKKLDDFQRAALCDGFGQDFSASFFGSSRQLNDSSGELDEIITNIVERL